MINSRLARAFRLMLSAVVLTAMVTVAAPAGAAPTTYYVDPAGGSDSALGTTEGTAYKTLHYATTMTSSGDTIIALPGTYSASSNGESFPLTLDPGVKFTSRDGAQTTIIDCENSLRAFMVVNATSGTEISGLTIKNGDSNGGGAIYIGFGQPSAAAGWPVIQKCSFVNNSAHSGGAIYVDGYSSGLPEPRIYDNEFIGNDATAGSGGAIYLSSYMDITVNGNYFFQNSASLNGGAIGIDEDLSITAIGNTFEMNEASGGHGGAIYNQHATTYVVGGNDFWGNTADLNGGAICANQAIADISASEFNGNHAGANGGALRINLSTDVDIFNNVIWDNSAGGSAGAVRVDDSAVTFDQNTVCDNSGGTFNGMYNQGVAPVVQGSIFWGHSGEDLRMTSVSQSCTEDKNLGDDANTVGTGMQYTDPMFFDAAEGDLRLQIGSPCIDAGAAGPSVDRLGTERPQDGDDNGSKLWDLGAWERPMIAVARVAGSDRYATAAEAATEAFESADTAVIASGQNFPDALSAAGLCGVHDAPLLLTKATSLPGATARALSDLGVTEVIIVGGPSAVSDAVKTALAADYEVSRIFGSDRYATAAKVAEEIASIQGPDFRQWAFVARGDEFPDALAVSPYSYNEGTPILLVKPTSMPQATRAALEDLDIVDAIIPGGTAAVSDSLKTTIDELLIDNGGKTSLRLSGTNRYATAATIASHARNKKWGDSAYVGIATGTNYPDALAGGVATGVMDGAILLTKPTSLPSQTSSELDIRGPKTVWCKVFGGTVAVSDSVRTDIRTALGW